MNASSKLKIHLLLIVASTLVASGCSTPLTFENEYGVVIPANDSGAFIPSGMRRTTNGWEDTSQWCISADFQDRSIDSWMDHQRRREPHWIRHLFFEIRTTPPLMVAVIQITAVAAIVHISRSKKLEQAG